MTPGMHLQTRARTAQAALVETKEQFLAFLLGRETFAMPIQSLREVIQCEEITPVPLMPGCVRGVINLRGAVVPVAGPGGPARPGATGRRQAYLHRGPGAWSGRKRPWRWASLVDQVSEVLELREADIEPVPAFGPVQRREVLAGVVNLEGRFILLLDPGPAAGGKRIGIPGGDHPG